jgi:hypothetical protein
VSYRNQAAIRAARLQPLNRIFSGEFPEVHEGRAIGVFGVE